MFLIFLFIFSIICVEALTELIIKSELFLIWREKQKKYSEFRDSLFSCGYCFSFWAAMPVAFIYTLILYRYSLLNLLLFFPAVIFFVLVMQRCANFIHYFVDRWLDKYYIKKD